MLGSRRPTLSRVCHLSRRKEMNAEQLRLRADRVATRVTRDAHCPQNGGAWHTDIVSLLGASLI